MESSLTPLFISLTARKIALRIIIISSLSSFLINMVIIEKLFGYGDNLAAGELMGLSIIPLSVFLHHILRLWPRKKWSTRFDFIYSTTEFIFVTGYLICEIIIITRSYSDSIMICSSALTLLWLSIGASFIFTVWDLHVSKNQEIQSTYDFMGKYDAKYSSIGRWSLLFGENTFKKRFGVDRMFVRGLRAVISILCLLGMITLGYLVLIVQPLQQEPYFQTMQTLVQMDGIMTMEIIPIIDIRGFSTKQILQDTALIDIDIKWLPESQHVPCSNVDGLLINHVTCDVQSPLDRSSPDYLIININYTRALQQFVSVSSLRTGVYLKFKASNNLKGSYESLTPPIQLYPGFHLFGTTFYSYEESYASSSDVALGIPHFDRHLIANVQVLIPDPDFTNSNTDNTTATLRLTYQGGSGVVQSTYMTRREQSSNTVLSGFALLGGVWTFISGLFAMIFGCELLLVLFGIKPLSIYGLVHLFQGRRSLVESGYTLPAEEQSRTIAVLRKHLLDEENDDVEVGKAREESRDVELSKLHDTV